MTARWVGVTCSASLVDPAWARVGGCGCFFVTWLCLCKASGCNLCFHVCLGHGTMHTCWRRVQHHHQHASQAAASAPSSPSFLSDADVLVHACEPASLKPVAFIHHVCLPCACLAVQFGSGFSNANYWYRAAAAEEHPINARVLAAAKAAAAGNERLERHVANHGSTWQPSRYVTLCSQAAEGQEEALLRFCSAVNRCEWDLLLNHCLGRL